MNNYYIGSNYGHSSSIAVIDGNGHIVFASEEERYNLKKGSDDFPSYVLLDVLEKFPNIEGWSEGWKINDRILYKGILSTVNNGFSNPEYFKKRFSKELIRYFKWQFYSKKWERKLNLKIDFVGHHLSHALSLLPWGLIDNSLILVSDTIGEKESISIYLYSGKKMNLLTTSLFPHSIGSLFHQMAYHLGYTGRTGPGKLMALSALGEPIWFDDIYKIFHISDAKLTIDSKLYPCNKISKSWMKYAESFCPNQKFKEEIIKYHMSMEKGVNLASSIQKIFEKVTYELILQGINLAYLNYGVKIKSVGLAGGSALNCQANGYIKRMLSRNQKIYKLFVSPWSEDGGTAIGAAVAQYWKNKPLETNIKKISTSFLGSKCCDKRKMDDNYIVKVTKLILQSEIVAIVDNKMEFGPRALGARCIIARADNTVLKNKLNKIKKRPSFMPFAPVILEEDYSLLFLDSGSSNMAWTVPFTEKGKSILSGAWHPSNEARVQVATKEIKETILYRILKELKIHTGVGALLLTSLNGNNQPIARTLDDSIRICKKLEIKKIISTNGIVNVT